MIVIDLLGRKFNLLTVIGLDNERTSSQNSHRYWVCKCECGNIISVRESKLVRGETKSCGCYRKNGWTREQDEILIDCYKNHIELSVIADKLGRTISAIKNRIVKLKLSSSHRNRNPDLSDIIGKKFGKLTVVDILKSDEEIPKNKTLYICDCDCGKNNIIASRKNLLSGKTKSCGCSRRKPRPKKPLTYINHENKYYECILTNGSSMYFDYEDYDIVYKYRWVRNSDGYICAVTDDNTNIFLHRLIMSKYYNIENLQIDHIHGKETRNDNRKNNLRVVTISQNRMNVGLKKNNKSGVTGVSWSNYYNVWVAHITKEGKTYCLGNFTDFDAAVAARKAAEEKYFGQYSFANSQAIDIDNLECGDEIFTGIARGNGE